MTEDEAGKNGIHTPKNRLKTFLLNGLLLTMVALFMRFVGMAFQLFVTEEAGSEAIGLYSVIGGVYGFAVTLATSGIQLGTTRMISEALGRDDYGEVRAARSVCFSYALFFGLLATALLFLGAKPIGIYLLKDERVVRSLKILACSLLPIALSSVLNGYFTAIRRVYKNAITGVIEQGVRIGITVMLLLYVFPKGIESACLALVLGSVLSEILSACLIGLLYCVERKQAKGGRTVASKAELRRRLCGISLPVAFSAYARSGLLTIEHMLIPLGLTAYFGDRSIALSSFGILHGVALPIVLFPSAILSSYSGLLVPEIAECRVRDEKRKVQRIVTAIFRTALLFSIGISGILLCFSYELGSMLENGAEVSYYIRMLAPLVPIMYLDNAVDAILKGHGEQVYCMQVNIIDSLLSVLLVYLLLPRMGMEGYISVIYITEILNAALSITRLLCVTDMKPQLFRILFAPLFSVIGATSVTRIVASLLFTAEASLFAGFTGLIIHILLSISLYVLLLFILGAIRTGEVRVLWRRLCFKEKTRRSVAAEPISIVSERMKRTQKNNFQNLQKKY